MSKFSKQVIGFPTPLEMANNNPLDPRFVVENVADLTNIGEGTPWLVKDSFTNVYPGMQVYVIANNSTYMYVGSSASTNSSSVSATANWRLISNAATSSDKILTNINVNSKAGTVSNHIASVTLNGADIKLGSNYDGEVVSGYTGAAISPTSADTINGSFAKLVKIIGDDEEVIAASANDLNTRLNSLSGKAVTELTSTGQTAMVTKSSSTNGTIKYNVEVPKYSFASSGSTNNISFTSTTSNNTVTVKGNIEILDCGTYD